MCWSTRSWPSATRAGSISPGTLSITATLTQAQQFRLLTPPGTAEVDVQGGPAPFTCTGLTLGAAPASPDPGGDPGGDPASTGRRAGHRRHHGALLGPARDDGVRRA